MGQVRINWKSRLPILRFCVRFLMLHVDCLLLDFFSIRKETLVWMLLLLLSCFSRVQLCATPETAAHQAPPSLGFSKQEHWSGLPFPSPMHESEKSKWSRSVVSDLATPWTAAYQVPPSMGFSRQEYWSGVPFEPPPPFTPPSTPLPACRHPSLVVYEFLHTLLHINICNTRV